MGRGDAVDRNMAKGGWEQPLSVELDPEFIPAEDSARLFRELEAAVPWRQESIVMFGRTVPVPRLQSWHGDSGARYRYSGLLLEPLPWLPPLVEIRSLLTARRPEILFNSVLVNLYRDGSDSMGWHSDDEPELGDEPEIASVSLGATRTFQFRHRSDRERPRIDLDLTDGSLLWMSGSTQREWQHALPKRRGMNAPGARINLTFRQILPDRASPTRAGSRRAPPS